TSHEDADDYDFLILGYKIDVKTRTEKFHIRTLELVEQINKRPKDIFVSTYYDRNKMTVDLIGVISKNKLIQLNQIENHGYKDNYVAYDNQLSSMEVFKQFINKKRD